MGFWIRERNGSMEMKVEMKMGMSRRTVWTAIAALAIGMSGLAGLQVKSYGQAGSDTVLSAADATKLLPASVYFKGQSATTQLRNSGGVKFADGSFVLATLVDTSGYSSDVQQKYQAYFITEVPIKIEGHALAAGIYGVGFVADNKFVVLDVGAHDLFSVTSHKDEPLKRPMPLKVVADGGGFRLYAGRSYVGFSK
jgi:hypothetical protein